MEKWFVVSGRVRGAQYLTKLLPLHLHCVLMLFTIPFPLQVPWLYAFFSFT
jgi:hypothetical protein